MTAEASLRRGDHHRAALVARAVLVLVPLAVPLVAAFAFAVVKDTAQYSSGRGDQPADNDIGSFVDRTPFIVCRLFENQLPGMVQNLASGDAGFVSPGGEPPLGDVWFQVRHAHANGEPNAMVFSQGPIDRTRPDFFPNTTVLDFDVQDAAPIPADAGSAFFICVRTTSAQHHVATFQSPGSSLWVSVDDGAFQEQPGWDMSVSLTVDSGPPGTSPPATPTGPPVTPTPPPATPTPPPGGEQYEVIAVFGSGQGAGNAFFDSRLDQYHPGGQPVLVQVIIVPRGTTVPELLQELTMNPERLREVLLSVLQPSMTRFGQGRVVTQSRLGKSSHGLDPMTQAVIYATLPDGREFGQYFQAVSPESAQQAGRTSLLFSTHDPVRYRVNVGVAAVEDGTRVWLTPLDDGGVELHPPVVVELDDGGSTQVNDIDAAWNLGGVPNVMVRAEVESGSAFPYGSILDGRGAVQGTSDPTTVLPVTDGARQVVLLEMGRITGLNEFSGSASLYNHAGRTITVDVAFYERGVPGVSDETTITVPGRTVVSWNDAVGDLVGRTGVVGSLVLTSRGGVLGGNISAIGREFAIYTDGGAVTGTAGQLLPGLAEEDRLMPGEVFHFIGLRERQLPEGPERSHLGVLNLGDIAVEMTVASFAADGTAEGSIQRTVRAGEQLRVNNVLSAINSVQDGELKRIEVTADGPLYVLAYRVNATGDPVTLLPFRR